MHSKSIFYFLFVTIGIYPFVSNAQVNSDYTLIKERRIHRLVVFDGKLRRDTSKVYSYTKEGCLEYVIDYSYCERNPKLSYLSKMTKYSTRPRAWDFEVPVGSYKQELNEYCKVNTVSSYQVYHARKENEMLFAGAYQYVERIHYKHAKASSVQLRLKDHLLTYRNLQEVDENLLTKSQYYINKSFFDDHDTLISRINCSLSGDTLRGLEKLLYVKTGKNQFDCILINITYERPLTDWQQYIGCTNFDSAFDFFSRHSGISASKKTLSRINIYDDGSFKHETEFDKDIRYDSVVREFPEEHDHYILKEMKHGKVVREWRRNIKKQSSDFIVGLSNLYEQLNEKIENNLCVVEYW